MPKRTVLDNLVDYYRLRLECTRIEAAYYKTREISKKKDLSKRNAKLYKRLKSIRGNALFTYSQMEEGAVLFALIK